MSETTELNAGATTTTTAPPEQIRNHHDHCGDSGGDRHERLTLVRCFSLQVRLESPKLVLEIAARNTSVIGHRHAPLSSDRFLIRDIDTPTKSVVTTSDTR